jgi:hypothetical protein
MTHAIRIHETGGMSLLGAGSGSVRIQTAGYQSAGDAGILA